MSITGTRTDVRTLLGKQPARILMLDLMPPFSSAIGEDVCEAIENLFSVACNISGPSRVPFFSVLALTNYPELLLPFSYVRNNFPRIQSAIVDIRGIVENLHPSDQSSCCIEQGLVEACSQYRQQLQSTLQILQILLKTKERYLAYKISKTGGFSHQLEIILLTCQRIVQMVENAVATLDLEHLKRIQIVSLSSLGSLMDNLSQTSLSSDHSSTNSISGVVEVVNIEPDFLCLQNFFNGWLLDSGTDSEHLHIILPPSLQGGETTILKCDLHERLLHPAQLPYHEQFTVHSDSATMKMVFPSTSKAFGMVVPLYKLQITNTVPVTVLCDTVVFGMPMVVTATSCWKVDWDELEKNQQLFKALCQALVTKDQALIGYLHPQDNTHGSTSTAHYEHVSKPQGRFVLLPSQNGTLLIKSIAVQELMLPCQVGSHIEEPTEENMNTITASLDQLDCLDTYNPLNHVSNLYRCLKNSNKKPTPRQQKRQLDTKSVEKQSCSTGGKMSRKSYPPPLRYSKGNGSGSSRSFQQSAYGTKRTGPVENERTALGSRNQPSFYESFDDDFEFDDNDENNNTMTFRHEDYPRKKPLLMFPTSL